MNGTVLDAKDGYTLIAPLGVFPHPLGEQVVDRQTAERILKQFQSWGRDVVVDYMHESLKECGRAPAAGWVKTATARLAEDGVEAVIEWTAGALNAIESKEYRFLSPVFITDGKSINGILNLGLTNNPNIHAMPPLVNEYPINKETMMTSDLNRSIREILGLGPDAPDSAALEAVKALLEKPSAQAEPLKTALGDKVALLGLTPDATEEEILARIEEMAKEAARDVESQTTQLVNDAVSAGKLRPALAGWANNLARKNPEALKVFLANSGPPAPLGGYITTCSSGKKPVSESEANVCALLNISESDFAKYGNL
ncbi:MAG: hypothetical protein HY751_03000 [Nitrospinae bacterium]|nr:hypothetical protein [Nitrospinota bacterium]